MQVDIALKIGGQGRVGADGLGIWYTSQLGALGPVFGGNDFWTGMGLFLDSFDNDGQKNNPQVSLMLNDGTRSYDHHTDGSQQILSSKFSKEKSPNQHIFQVANEISVISHIQFAFESNI